MPNPDGSCGTRILAALAVLAAIAAALYLTKPKRKGATAAR